MTNCLWTTRVFFFTAKLSWDEKARVLALNVPLEIVGTNIFILSREYNVWLRWRSQTCLLWHLIISGLFFFSCYEILHLFFCIIFYHGCYKINFSHCTFWAFKGALTSKLYASLSYAWNYLINIAYCRIRFDIFWQMSQFDFVKTLFNTMVLSC